MIAPCCGVILRIPPHCTYLEGVVAGGRPWRIGHWKQPCVCTQLVYGKGRLVSTRRPLVALHDCVCMLCGIGVEGEPNAGTKDR